MDALSLTQVKKSLSGTRRHIESMSVGYGVWYAPAVFHRQVRPERATAFHFLRSAARAECTLCGHGNCLFFLYVHSCGRSPEISCICVFLLAHLRLNTALRGIRLDHRNCGDAVINVHTERRRASPSASGEVSLARRDRLSKAVYGRSRAHLVRCDPTRHRLVLRVR